MINYFLNWANKRNSQSFKTSDDSGHENHTFTFFMAEMNFYPHNIFIIEYSQRILLQVVIYGFGQKMIALVNIMSNEGKFKQINKRNNQAFKRVMASVMKTICENANSKSLWTKREIHYQ